MRRWINGATRFNDRIMLIFHGWNIYGYSAGNIYGYSAAPCAKFCYAWIHICVQGTPGACVLICFEIDCSWKHSWIYVANSAAIYDNIAQPRIQNTFRMNPYVFKFLSICFQSFLSILFPKPFMQHILVLRINIVCGENVLFPNFIRMKTWIISIILRLTLYIFYSLYTDDYTALF